jgi:hypothetical protein
MTRTNQVYLVDGSVIHSDNCDFKIDLMGLHILAVPRKRPRFLPFIEMDRRRNVTGRARSPAVNKRRQWLIFKLHQIARNQMVQTAPNQGISPRANFSKNEAKNQTKKRKRF